MISILITSGSRYPISRPKIKAKVTQMIEDSGLQDVEVSILIAGERKLRQLNQQYRQLDQATEVLAFPLEEPRDQEGLLRLGDIIICYPEAQEIAREENKFVDEVIDELVEHGLKHLLGFNHDNSLKFKVPTSKIF